MGAAAGMARAASLPPQPNPDHALELHIREKEVLQKSLSELYNSMSIKDKELERANAGRKRLRGALQEQREFADQQLKEVQRQMLTSQRQLRAAESGAEGPGSSLADVQAKLEVLLGAAERDASRVELKAQTATLGAAHQLHVQQQEFVEKLQRELAAMRERERKWGRREGTLQAKLQELAKEKGVANPAAATAAAKPTEQQTYLEQASAMFGAGATQAAQLSALQSSFRSAMAELAKQTAENQSIGAELAALKEEAKQRKKAAPALGGGGGGGGGKAAATPRTAPRNADTATGDADGDADEAAEEEEEQPTAEQVEAQRAAAEAATLALKEAAASFGSVLDGLNGIAEQRRSLEQGSRDITWQLKRLDPSETLEEGDDPKELKRKIKQAEAKQKQAEEAQAAAAHAHAAQLKRERDSARQAQQRATKAEMALKAGGGGGGGGGGASKAAVTAAKGSKEQMAAVAALAEGMVAEAEARGAAIVAELASLEDENVAAAAKAERAAKARKNVEEAAAAADKVVRKQSRELDELRAEANHLRDSLGASEAREARWLERAEKAEAQAQAEAARREEEVANAERDKQETSQRLGAQLAAVALSEAAAYDALEEKRKELVAATVGAATRRALAAAADGVASRKRRRAFALGRLRLLLRAGAAAARAAARSAADALHASRARARRCAKADASSGSAFIVACIVSAAWCAPAATHATGSSAPAIAPAAAACACASRLGGATVGTWCSTSQRAEKTRACASVVREV